MTGPILAGLLAAGAALLLLPASARPGRPTGPGGLPRAPGPWISAFLGASLVGGAVAVLEGTTLVLGLITLASAADVARRLRRRQVRRRLDHQRGQVLVACEAMAADIRAGATPVAALDAAAGAWPELGGVARAARFGADVTEALRSLAIRPGAERLATIASAWAVAHRTGAPMAAALDLAAATLRDERAVAEVVATEIAAARATATVLALLPVGVLVLGQGIGGDAIGFLTATPAGLVCLASGLGLAHLGLAWLDAITERLRP